MIHEILHLNYRSYAIWRDEHFYKYCQLLSQNTMFTIRELYSNDLMLNYFHDMWHAYVEKPFLQDYADLINQLDEPDHFWNILETYIGAVYDENSVRMYSSAILNEIKKEKKLCKKC
ncbi:hypothetical protein EDL99_11250 [Ornithobacterium rhinotracheale]|uniref:hypothetical protein n=1 Tax=Ornithobacterium rhinotracheale TaxID=28251 RepID=UPI00129CAFF8|nr:hypothetical protein [Ornithobacterium rhinotracheale]MRJ09425.1 hypothetical protein [Ornithobacterium rhinotracheale]UOH77224.1 hypothetical protein MT996_08380 [Ornithobacterium rhinotracheale]UOH77338.1 hypothetical protein MT996_08970 [Ornithobacterium rhinotracheale]UOH77649.1 hypothetical protein MT996_10640 [Ornithobacterium rhinotracheale]